MRLESIAITNFKALRSLSLSNLKDVVVLAGPNGCGKSCVLDAIRLLKSAYGSYQQDEWQQWLSEFQISLKGGVSDLGGLFHSESQRIQFAAEFAISEEERTYLTTNCDKLLTELAWRDSNHPMMQHSAGGFSQTPNRRADREQVVQEVDRTLPAVRSALSSSMFRAEVTIEPNGHVNVRPNAVLELLFSVYDSQRLGVIDYHGPHRNYGREPLNNINLTIDSPDRLRQHALYNYNNKYSSVKAELASAYIRHLLSRQADNSLPASDALTESLKELFTIFFPGKEFLGPQPTADGHLRFMIKLPGGGEHDIDSLSSGEKEILYGYLRLHNSRPKHSLIMIDEPELHLNPRLVAGLASFYYRHLGQALGNQLLLVTHSDTLIRESVAHKQFSVYHIHPSAGAPGDQATLVESNQAVDGLVIELVGDLAAYRPGAKIVIFESTEDAAFDKRMTCSLFPEFEQKINAISGGNKRRVNDLYDVLERVSQQGHIPGRFFAITDSDDELDQVKPTKKLRWNVYHIENYLLESRFVLEALRAIGISNRFTDAEAVDAALITCARATIPQIVQHKLRNHVNKQLLSCLDLRCDPGTEMAAVAIAQAAERSSRRIEDIVRNELSNASLSKMEQDLAIELTSALTTDAWMTRFRGRDVLKRFVSEHVAGMRYEPFRELIITRMREASHKPAGMKTVIDTILNA